MSRDQEGFSGGQHPNLEVNRGDDLLYKSRFMGKMKAHSLSKYGAKCEHTFFLRVIPQLLPEEQNVTNSQHVKTIALKEVGFNMSRGWASEVSQAEDQHEQRSRELELELVGSCCITQVAQLGAL